MNNSFEWKLIKKHGMPNKNGLYYVTIQVTDGSFSTKDSVFVAISYFNNNIFEEVFFSKDKENEISKYKIVSYAPLNKVPLPHFNECDFYFSEPKDDDVIANNIVFM